MIRAADTMRLAAPASRIWDHAWSLWQALMAAISGRYRPELHYMRGPGPKWREKQSRSGNSDDRQMYCPSCNVVMVLERVAPKLGPLPELRTYKCLKCGNVVSCEIEH
jgi:hypothetical protein